MARRVERQPAHRIDIIFQFTHAFAGVHIDPGEILRINIGKDQAFRSGEASAVESGKAASISPAATADEPSTFCRYSGAQSAIG